MKSNSLLVFALLFLTSSTALPQKPKEETKAPKGLIISYDKFRERTSVLTKPFNLFFIAGNKSYTCAAVLGYTKAPDQTPPIVALIIRPGSVGFMAALSEELNKGSSGRAGTLYFDPDADVIILVGDNRYKLGRVSKDYGLYPSGDVKSSIAVEIPLDVLRALVNAEQWEMAVGSLETQVGKKHAKSLRERLLAFESQLQKDSISDGVVK